MIQSSSDDTPARSNQCGICHFPLGVPRETHAAKCGHHFHVECIGLLKEQYGLSEYCSSCIPRTRRRSIRPVTELEPRFKDPAESHDCAARRYVVIEQRVLRGALAWDSLSGDDAKEMRTIAALWQDGARSGHAYSQLGLGYMCMRGWGRAPAASDGESDVGDSDTGGSGSGWCNGGRAVALDWFKLAAESGLPEAQYRLGLALERGGGERVGERASGDKLGAAAAGHPAADPAADPAAAVAWLRRAGEQGHTRALLDLGDMFSEGGVSGVAADGARAAFFWRKAAGQGHPRAQYNMAVLHLGGGSGVAQSDAEAVGLLTRSADQGFAAAEHALGTLHDRGRCGLQPSAEAAVALWARAAEQGHAAACADLALATAQGRGGLAQDFSRAAELLERVAAGGDPAARAMALCNLGCMYFEGVGVGPPDKARARSLLEAAAGMGDAVATEALGALFPGASAPDGPPESKARADLKPARPPSEKPRTRPRPLSKAPGRKKSQGAAGKSAGPASSTLPSSDSVTTLESEGTSGRSSARHPLRRKPSRSSSSVSSSRHSTPCDRHEGCSLRPPATPLAAPDVKEKALSPTTSSISSSSSPSSSPVPEDPRLPPLRSGIDPELPGISEKSVDETIAL